MPHMAARCCFQGPRTAVGTGRSHVTTASPNCVAASSATRRCTPSASAPGQAGDKQPQPRRWGGRWCSAVLGGAVRASPHGTRSPAASAASTRSGVRRHTTAPLSTACGHPTGRAPQHTAHAPTPSAATCPRHPSHSVPAPIQKRWQTGGAVVAAPQCPSLRCTVLPRACAQIRTPPPPLPFCFRHSVCLEVSPGWASGIQMHLCLTVECITSGLQLSVL